MRPFVLVGFLTFAVARHAGAQTPEPDEPPIELGPPPPPPPGARVIEPDEPSPPSPTEDGGVPPTPTAPTPSEPEPIPVFRAPSSVPPVARTPEPRSITPAPSDVGAPAPRRRKGAGWYGWKVLIADGGALFLAVVDMPLAPILGGGVYLLTAPSIHLGHRRPLAALGSLSLRIAAPLALNALVEHEPCGPDPCVAPGVLAGAMLASLFDVVFLAHDSVPPKVRKAERVTPAVAVGPKGSTLFLSGSF